MTGNCSQFDHLHEEYRNRAGAKNDERIRWIQSDRWIPYPQAVKILNQCRDLLNYPPRGRMPCILLCGHTGMGKTKIIEKFVRDHSPAFCPATGTRAMPVVAFQLPTEPLERAFCRQMLSAMGNPPVAAEGHNKNAFRDVAIHLMEEMGTRMLVLDEFNALLCGTARAQRLFLTEIRLLANELRIPLLCAGTADARAALMTDAQLADRFMLLEMSPWRADTDLINLLVSFEVTLPLRKSSALATTAVAKKVVQMTGGITVRILRLIENVAVQAILSGRETLDEQSFDDETLVLPLASMGGPRRYR